MKLKEFITILTIMFAGFCPADDQLICTNNLMLFTLKYPFNYKTDIQFLDGDQQIYKNDLRIVVPDEAVTKKVLIDFSSDGMKVKHVAFNDSGRVISRGFRKYSNFKKEKDQPLTYKITFTNKADKTISSTHHCYSEANNWDSVAFDKFINKFDEAYNGSFLEELQQKDILGSARVEVKEQARELIDKEMYSLGYRKNVYGLYYHVNSTQAIDR